jgi:hypothetical protein
MASLVVKLHEIVNEYIKKANDKELAGKIGSEVLLRSKEVVKKYMYVGEDACMYHVAELYPMVSRELLCWTRIACRRMKAATCLAHPWQVCIVRNMHEEIFNLLRLTVINLKLRMGSYTTPSHLPVLFSPFLAGLRWMRLRMLAMQSGISLLYLHTKHARVCSKFDEINCNLLK